jgi:hypothetical protein
MNNPQAEQFMAYPTHRVTCYFESQADFQSAMKQFAAAGFDVKDIFVLHGQRGVEILDIDGERHGMLARLSRMVQRIMSEYEVQQYEIMKEHLEQGHIVIGVSAPHEQEREKIHRIMHDNHGHHIMYFGQLYIETIEE